MDILRGILPIAKKINNSLGNPSVQEWFEHIPPDYLAFLCIGCVFTIMSILLAVLHLIYVLSFISNEQIRTDLYFFVFMCPAISLCGSIGMILPRAALFLYAIALVYFMLCLFVCITLMTTLHGSRSAMCEKLMERGVRISVRVMPIGCCFFCFPKLAPTEIPIVRRGSANFLLAQLEGIHKLVLKEINADESPLVRIFLEVLNIVVFFELNDRNNIFFQISNLIGIISLFIGSYGSYMIIPPGSQLLSAYRFSIMFRMVDFSQLAYSVQKFVFDFLAAVGVFANGPHLPDTAKAQFFTSFLLTLEMLFVSVLATILFRPSKTIFFDKYNGGQTRVRDASSVDVPGAEGVDAYGKLAVPKLALSLDEVGVGIGQGQGQPQLAGGTRHFEQNLQFTNLSIQEGKQQEQEDFNHNLEFSIEGSVSPTGLSPEENVGDSVSQPHLVVANGRTNRHPHPETIYTVSNPPQSRLHTPNGNVVVVGATRRSIPTIVAGNPTQQVAASRHSLSQNGIAA